jgi:hypothetical protein
MRLRLYRLSDPPTGVSYTQLSLVRDVNRNGELRKRHYAILRGTLQLPFLCRLGIHHYPKRTTGGRGGPDGHFDVYRCIRRVGAGPSGATCNASREIRRG